MGSVVTGCVPREQSFGEVATVPSSISHEPSRRVADGGGLDENRFGQRVGRAQFTCGSARTTAKRWFVHPR